MKKTKTLYWIFTALFAASMLFSAVPDAMLKPDAIQFMTTLGYPNYFTRFIGVAKILGSVAILLPIPKWLKDLAYAGLFFDLFGAIYSMVAVNGFQPQMLGMLIWVVLFSLSYIYYNKMLREKAIA